ncbi:hypothetical protein ACP70R_036044 [Stipagrostis hirtigluma subsp. patula]
MADIENPAGPVAAAAAGAVAAKAQEPDVDCCGCTTGCCFAYVTCAFIAVCALPALFYAAHRTAGPGVRTVAVVLFVLEVLGFFVAAFFCIAMLVICLCGDTGGRRRRANRAAAAV